MPNAAEIGCKQQISKLGTSLFPILISLRCNRQRRYAPSIENLPGFEARAAFTVNSASVFREYVDIVPTAVDDSLSYIPWGGDNQPLAHRPNGR